MRCPNCRDRLIRTSKDGVLVRGGYLLVKSEGIVIRCKSCRTLVDVKRPSTLLKVKDGD